MKKIILLIVILISIFFIIGCSSKATEYNLDFLIYKVSDEVTSWKLNVNNSCLKISNMPLYVLPLEGPMSGERLYPQHWSDESIILRTNPISVIDEYQYDISDESLRYYRDYVLEKNGDEWELTKSAKSIYKCIMINEGDLYSPLGFYVDESTHKIYILCIYNEVDYNANIGVFVFDNEKNNKEINFASSVIFYKDNLNYLNISPPNYPYYFYNGTNIKPFENGFLYNEGANIYLIKSSTEEISLLLNETIILKDMPFLDTYRESYSFFSSIGYQEGYYFVSFIAWNSLAGMYVAIYDINLEYKGYISITENTITLFDKNNKSVDSINDSFLTRIYLH